ncbi:hypothetical protein QTP88_025685 [Uroleucon formosanum]
MYICIFLNFKRSQGILCMKLLYRYNNATVTGAAVRELVSKRRDTSMYTFYQSYIDTLILHSNQRSRYDFKRKTGLCGIVIVQRFEINVFGFIVVTAYHKTKCNSLSWDFKLETCK